MVFNLADDSRNLVFRKGIDSVDYEQIHYIISFKSLYSNKWLTNITPSGVWYQSPNQLVISLTKVDDNDNYISFSWDKNDIDGFGTTLSIFYNKNDINGDYILSLRACNVMSGYVNSVEISNHICKLINDYSTDTNLNYTINKATKEEETGGEYIYYRG